MIERKISRGLFTEYMEIDHSEVDEYLLAEGFTGKNYETLMTESRHKGG